MGAEDKIEFMLTFNPYGRLKEKIAEKTKAMGAEFFIANFAKHKPYQ